MTLHNERVEALRLIGDIGAFIAHERRWWLAPLGIALVLIGAFVALAEATPFVPFLYPLF